MGAGYGAREEEFSHRLTGFQDAASAEREVALTIERIYTYAAWADKYDGLVHHTPYRNVTLAMPEPIGVLGVVAPEDWPLLGFVSTVLPAFAMGNTVVAVPSSRAPLAATDLYQVLDTSDVPAGAINIVTGLPDELARVLLAMPLLRPVGDRRLDLQRRRHQNVSSDRRACGDHRVR